MHATIYSMHFLLNELMQYKSATQELLHAYSNDRLIIISNIN